MSTPAVSRPQAPCPSRDVLLAFSVGDLPEETQEAVAAHLKDCASCVAALEQLDDSGDAMLAELRQPLPPAMVARPHDSPLLRTPRRAVVGRNVGTVAAFRISPAKSPRYLDELSPGSTQRVSPAPGKTPLPERIGRYRVERELGKGSFGMVYLAHDDQLSRSVAIKVPHTHVLAESGDAQAYLTEARTVASLDHPNIVPVHDVGSTPETPFFVVAKYIDGIDLATRLTACWLTVHEAVELAATIADALHYAHRQGLVHRDIKPANLLIDQSGKPFVADFGLALREQDIDKGPRYAGTPAYMSPEQARGEGHRVDGRSDIFSLGVVLYELLTGKLPFHGNSREELLRQIAVVEARPPRQWDDRIPKELERICLKALAKRATERYTTARDFADELRQFLADAPSAAGAPAALRDGNRWSGARAAASSDAPYVMIVPKGLRAFDAGDADFFLELLPGPRDRGGLPESLRFWKNRIETGNADGTFAVGLIYGPSGCGKSSLVKAGLLPRLARTVAVVYVEAGADQTEGRLLKGLRRQIAELPDNVGLVEALGALRRGTFLESGRKVLLVLDQFEQWLHARRKEEHPELVQALRQCDGGRVQALVLLRDDFWMGATRFMRELEIPLLEGQNALAVDLFDAEHARKVLAAYGRAFGRLSSNTRDMGREHKQFLDQVIDGLARDGKIIPARLALFAEMVKSKAWTPATLREVGGTEGVDVNFLEETFASASAPLPHRLHQKAAEAVLKALLPDAGTDLKGAMRSRQTLLSVSGYSSRTAEFNELLNILDGELRLITPSDPDEKDEQTNSSLRCYQLTHDYLVPPLRDWLTRKQKETPRGRAELLLEDRAKVWSTRPESRQLPPLGQWLQIRRLTRKQDWTPAQRLMMDRASRYHLGRSAIWVGILFAVVLTGVVLRSFFVQQKEATEAAGLVGQLLKAEIVQVPVIIKEMKGYRDWVDPLLRTAAAEAEQAERKAAAEGEEDERARQAARHLHASLGLLPVDAGQVPYLYGRLLDAEPREALILRDALREHQAALTPLLWKTALQPDRGKEHQRLGAAFALAVYDPIGPRWRALGKPVVDQLVKVQSPEYQMTWREGFAPVRDKLLDGLVSFFKDRRPDRTGERNLASNMLAHYVADQPGILAKLLMDADERQFDLLFPKVRRQSQSILPLLRAHLTHRPAVEAMAEDRETQARHLANTAIALIRLSESALAWPLLRHSPDPTARSWLIHRLAPCGVDPAIITRHLTEEQDITIRRALVLSLGQFGDGAWDAQEKKVLVDKIQHLYSSERDPGLHAAAAWLLRQWHEETWLSDTDMALARQSSTRQTKLLRPVQESGNAAPYWYVNGQAQTMVVIPGPVAFAMGSPVKEPKRFIHEQLHPMRIPRTFAIAAKPVTLAEYQASSDPKYILDAHYAGTTQCPAVKISWYQALRYCNWLSQKEGIPYDQWCYDDTKDSERLLVKRGYLRLTGYRLPTEAEWEYACRAGATTRWYCGESEELLGNHAWHFMNSADRAWPVGSKQPNDLGLFDMHGNVWCWCHVGGKAYPSFQDGEPIEDSEDTTNTVLRGGSYIFRAWGLRCANRYTFLPTASDSATVGFRVARTLPKGETTKQVP